MPTPDAADSHLYDVAPSEHADGEQEEESDTVPNERPIAAAEEIAAISNNTRYILRRSTTDQHVLSTMTIKEAVLVYGDSAVQEAGRVELQKLPRQGRLGMHTTRCQSESPYPFQAFPYSEDVPQGEIQASERTSSWRR